MAAPKHQLPTLTFIDTDPRIVNIIRGIVEHNKINTFLIPGTTNKYYPFVYEPGVNIETKKDETHAIFVYPSNSKGDFGGGISVPYMRMFQNIQKKLHDEIKKIPNAENVFSVGSAILVPLNNPITSYLLAAPTMHRGGTHLPPDNKNIYYAMIAILKLLQQFRGHDVGKTITNVFIPGIGTGVGSMPLIVAATQICKALCYVYESDPQPPSDALYYINYSTNRNADKYYKKIQLNIPDAARILAGEQILQPNNASDNNQHNARAPYYNNSPFIYQSPLPAETIYFTQITHCTDPAHRGGKCYQASFFPPHRP